MFGSLDGTLEAPGAGVLPQDLDDRPIAGENMYYS